MNSVRFLCQKISTTTFNNLSSNDSLRSFTCNGKTSLVYPESGKCFDWVELTEAGKVNYPILPALNPQQQFVQAKQGSHYFVRVYDCATSDCGKVTQPRSPEESGMENDCNDDTEFQPILYPNPNSGSFQLQLNLAVSGNYQLIVSDILGRIHYDESKSIDANNATFSVDLTNTDPGIYHLHVIAPNGISRYLTFIIIR